MKTQFNIFAGTCYLALAIDKDDDDDDTTVFLSLDLSQRSSAAAISKNSLIKFDMTDTVGK